MVSAVTGLAGGLAGGQEVMEKLGMASDTDSDEDQAGASFDPFDISKFSIKNAKSYLDQVAYELPLNELYRVQQSCHYSSFDKFCPVLLRLGDHMIKTLYEEKNGKKIEMDQTLVAAFKASQTALGRHKPEKFDQLKKSGGKKQEFIVKMVEKLFGDNDQVLTGKGALQRLQQFQPVDMPTNFLADFNCERDSYKIKAGDTKVKGDPCARDVLVWLQAVAMLA